MSGLYKKHIFSRFVKERDGAISVEFAFLAPVFIASILFASNLALTIVNHQKLAAAVNTSATYLQDQVAEDGGTSLGNQEYDDNGVQVDNKIKRTAKVIVEEAFGKSFNGNDATVTFYCACPPAMPSGEGDEENNSDFEFTGEPFYTLSAISMGRGSDVCPSTCDTVNGEQQRVIAKISATYKGYNLFGQKQEYHQEISTRLR